MEHFDAVKAVYLWQYTNGDNFNNILLGLFAKADWQNFRRLQKGFPEIAAAFLEWRESPNPDDFFARYGMSHQGIKLERRESVDRTPVRGANLRNDA